MNRSTVTVGNRQDLGGCLREIFDPAFWKYAFQAVPSGAYRWSLSQLGYTAIAMALSPQPTLGDRFSDGRELTAALFCRRHRPGQTYQGFADALAREGEPLGRELRRRLQQVMGPGLDRWEGLAFAVDGSRQLVVHSAANVAAFGETRIKNRTASAPQLLVAAAVHIGSQVLYDWEVAGGNASEPALIARLIDRLPAGALVVKDAGTVSYDWIRGVLDSKRHLLMRVAGNFSLYAKSVATVARRGGTVFLWPAAKAGERPLRLRLIALPRKGPAKRKKGRKRGRKKGKGSKPRTRYIYLLTDLSPAELSEAQAGRFYWGRWGANEIGFRRWKQTLGARKMLSRSPEMAKLESFYSLLALQLLQVLQFLASSGAPRRGSVANTWRLWRKTVQQRVAGHCRADFGGRLRQCVLDDYQRHRPKQRRRAPQKKRLDRLGPPLLRKVPKALKLKWEREYQHAG